MIYLLRGLVGRAFVFLFVMLIMSVLPRLLPGDTLDLLLGGDATQGLNAQQIEALRENLGLAGDLWQLTLQDMTTLFHGQFGFSAPHNASVASILVSALPWTLLLVALATPIFLSVSILTAIEAGKAAGSRLDRRLTALMSLFASIPPYVSAVFLMLIFAILIPVFPEGGAEPLFPPEQPFLRAATIAQHAILPAIALSLHEVIRYFFLLRGECEALSRRAFVVNAKARGVSGLRLRRDYFARNLLPVIFGRLGHSVSTLFGAVLYVEVVFGYPGIGLVLYQAVLDRDYPLMRGGVAAIAVIVLILNWLFDVLAEFLAKRG